MAPQIVRHRWQPGQHRGLWEFQVVAMFCQEIDPLPRACDPKRRPGPLRMDQSLALLPIRALEFVRVRHRFAFDRLHPRSKRPELFGWLWPDVRLLPCPSVLSFSAWKERKDDDACQTTPLFRVEAIELIIAHSYLSEQSLLEGATTARWRMSRSLAVVEQSAFLCMVLPVKHHPS